jgi:hypothetical protein
MMNQKDGYEKSTKQAQFTNQQGQTSAVKRNENNHIIY